MSKSQFMFKKRYETIILSILEFGYAQFAHQEYQVYALQVFFEKISEDVIPRITSMAPNLKVLPK